PWPAWQALARTTRTRAGTQRLRARGHESSCGEPTLLFPISAVDHLLAQLHAALDLRAVAEARRAAAFDRAGRRACREGRGLERVVRLLVAHQERRREDVTGAGGVLLLARQRRHLVNAVAAHQREAAPASRERDDRDAGQEVPRARVGIRHV